jgi:hypothetical protein
MTNTVKAIWYRVQQKSADELGDAERRLAMATR